MGYGMPPISIDTVQIERNLWVTAAVDVVDGTLVACTSSNTSLKEAEKRVKNAVKRFGQLDSIQNGLQTTKASQIARRLGDLIHGKGDPFKLDEISTKNWTPARLRISKSLLEVPRGKVISYGGLAKRAQSSPRGVGAVMVSNPVPWGVPCHRVIHADARLGKYGGTTKGTKFKARILKAEGVPFLDKDVVRGYALID